MSDDTGIIILKREPGPVHGTSLVTVDAPGYTQAELIVAERFKDTPEEQRVLRQMLEERRALREAAKQGEV